MAEKSDQTIKSTINDSDLTYHERIGSGARSTVFRVTLKSESLGELEAAAKKIPINSEQSLAEQFGKEINLLHKLNHENVLKYYGHVVTPTHLITITEYAANGSLFEHLKRRSQIGIDLKRQWAIQAAKGVQYLQDQNITLTDIRSPNFMIMADNTLKVSDYGLARDLTSAKALIGGKGVFRWLAPEIFREHSLQLTSQANIFALGVVFWELETCEVPYKEERPVSVINGVQCENTPLRPDINDGEKNVRLLLVDQTIHRHYSSKFKKVVTQCWARSPAQRPSIAQVIQSLQEMESGLGLTLSNHSTISLPKPNANGALCWVSNSILAVCAANAVCLYHVGPRKIDHLFNLHCDKGVPKDVAVPNSNQILVIRENDPQVYSYSSILYAISSARDSHSNFFLRQSPIVANKTHTIDCDRVSPWCIVANSNQVILGMSCSHTLVVAALPEFTEQNQIHTCIDPIDLCITSDHLLVMGARTIIVKPLAHLDQDLYKLNPTNDQFKIFKGIGAKLDSKEIPLYVVCSVEGVKGKGDCSYSDRKSELKRVTNWSDTGKQALYETVQSVSFGRQRDFQWIGQTSVSVTAYYLAMSEVGSGHVALYTFG